ncbi:hypothetical protein OQA88_13617 [Cercophora sp. LCS_1]
MEFWDERARPTILEAVQAACDTLRQDLSAELQQRDLNRHVFLTEEVDRLKAAATRTEQLEKENQQLRNELEELRRERRIEPSTIGTGLQVPEEIPAIQNGGNDEKALEDAHRNLKREHEDLTKEFGKLAKCYRNLDARFTAKRKAAERLKEGKEEWIQYAQKQERKVKFLEKKLAKHGISSAPVSSTTDAPPPPPATEPSSVEHEAPAPDASFRSNPESNSGPEVHDDVVAETRQARRAVSDPLAPATRPDAREPAQEAGASTETLSGDEFDEFDEHDAPELPALPEDFDIGGGTAVKQEPLSDDLVVVSERAVRKRKLEEGSSRMPPPSLRVKCEPSSDPVVTGEATAFSPHESLDLDADHEGMPTPRKPRQPHSHHDEPEKANDPTSTPGPTGLGGRNQASRHTRARESREEAPSRATLDDGVAAVAEDGSECSASPGLERTPLAPNTAPPKHGKLQRLLDPDTPRSAPPVLRALRPTELNARRGHFDTELDLMALRYGRKKAETPVKPATVVKPRPSLPNSRPQKTPVQPKQGSVRKRPLAELRLEDFKINPKYNNGYTHAFDEVVRGKAERAELEGCIDPQCCGKKFRAMAQSELDNTGISILSRPGDVKLMEDYLGDEAYRLIGMAVEDKKKLWTDAKIRDLANRLGRHRQRYARRPSPPGFWDADFPSTQEVRNNKEEGEKRQRQIIEERYREAMRGGGKWLFRDE